MARGPEVSGVLADPLDRRDDVRRRIYLACLIVGIPSMIQIWISRRGVDPYAAWTYPPYTLSLAAVLVGLLRRRLSVNRAERIVLLATCATFLTGFVVGLAFADDLAVLRARTNTSALLTINLMAMLAYVAFETRQALRFSVVVVGVYATTVAVRIAPLALNGELGPEAADYVSILVFLVTSVGLLHVMAQVKEQAAEARTMASAMHTLANTDALTGIANRRHLHDILDGKVHAGVFDSGAAVVLLDLDHFKVVNDTYGHETGDAVLRSAAAALRSVTRPGDLVGRWGGEEFLVIAPDTTAEEAGLVAERCRAALSDDQTTGVGRVTASFGVAVPEVGESSWSVLQRADRALYEAKAAGRDRVHQATSTRVPAQERTRSSSSSSSISP